MISNEKGRPNNGGYAQKYRLLCARVFWKGKTKEIYEKP